MPLGGYTYRRPIRGPLAQLAEQQPLNLWVLGSIPRRLTTHDSLLRSVLSCLSQQHVEHGLSAGDECSDEPRAVDRRFGSRSRLVILTQSGQPAAKKAEPGVRVHAKVAELVYALDLGSSLLVGWGVESPLSHHSDRSPPSFARGPFLFCCQPSLFFRQPSFLGSRL